MESQSEEKKVVRQDYVIPDEMWAKIEPLLPPRKPHPLGCHRPRVPDRAAMNAIFYVLRTGMQWNALNETGICSSSSAHRRFQEWTEAGVFEKIWELGLLAYDKEKGIDWDWVSMDGCMTKAPLGGEKVRKEPDRPGQAGHQAQSSDRSRRNSHRSARGRSEPERLQDDQRDA